MKKTLLTLVALALALIVVMSAVTLGSAEEKVKLTFWDECPGTVQTPLFKELLDEFMAQNPEIEVEYVGIMGQRYEKYDVVRCNAADVAASTTLGW